MCFRILCKPPLHFVQCTLKLWFDSHVFTPLWLGWFSRYVVFLCYSQWGLSLAPALSSSLAMGTLLVMMAMSRGSRPSLFGVLRSSSSKLYWDKSSCTKSNSWCSTASNNASLLWNCDRKKVDTCRIFHIFYASLYGSVDCWVFSSYYPDRFATNYSDTTGLNVFDFVCLTHDGGFAQPLLVRPPSWHHTVLQTRGVGAKLSRQVAVKTASCAWRGQAGWFAGRGWRVGLVPPHGLCHLGSVSPGGDMGGQQTRRILWVREKSRIWHLIQQTDPPKLDLDSLTGVKALNIITGLITQNAKVHRVWKNRGGLCTLGSDLVLSSIKFFLVRVVSLLVVYRCIMTQISPV